MNSKEFVKKKSYKFTDKKHSVKGMISTVFFLMSLGLVVYAVYLSFKFKGEGPIAVGALGMEAFLVSAGGFAMGIYSFKEDNIFHHFPWLGTVGNAVVWFFVAATILVGL